MFRRFCKPNDLSGVHAPVDTRLPMARDNLREHLERHKQNKMHTIQDITSLVESFDKVLVLDSDPALLEARNIFVKVLQKMKQDELAKVQAAKLDVVGIEKMYSQSPEHFARLKRAQGTLYNALSRQGGVTMFYSLQDLKDIVRAFDELIALEPSPVLLIERDMYANKLKSKETDYKKHGPSIFESENDPPEIKTFQEKVQTIYDGTFVANETKAMQETGMDYAARRGMYG